MRTAPRPFGPFFRCLLLLFFVAWAAFEPLAQPVVAWDKTLGGEGYEELNGLLPVADGIMVAGSSRSNVAFGDPADNSWNFLIFKTDLNGNLLWQRMYGGDQDERLWAFVQTSDGGFLAGGYSYSGVSGDKTEPSRGDKDVWLIKLDAQGLLLWDKTLGGGFQDELFSIQELPNGDFLLGCNSNSNASGDKSEGTRGQQDFWLIRTDAQGNKLWDNTLGGNGLDLLNDIERAPDGDFFLCGGTTSLPSTGDVGPAFARGGMDFWLLKFSADTRQIAWQRRFGGTGEDYPYSLCVSASGKMYYGGRSGSPKGPPTTYNNGKDADFYGGDSDYWLLELDTDGQKIRDFSFGGSGLDDLYFIQAHECGGLTLGGVTDSGASGNKTTAGRGGYDFWLLGLNENGDLLWQQTVGGANDDALTKIATFPNGSFIVGGHSASDVGFEKTQNSFGLNDFWVLRSECGLAAGIRPSSDPVGCTEVPIFLDATVPDCPTCSYQWSTGDTARVLELPPGTSGFFSVKVCNGEGCVARDTIFVDAVPPPAISLGASDTIVAQGEILTFGVSGGGPSWTYFWSTGAATPSISVGEAGLYAVTVTDENGCTAVDSLRLEVRRERHVWVPNVFSPDADGYNDYVSIYSNESVRRVVTFQIADRWGTLVFRRDDFLTNYLDNGWDGNYRGRPAPPAVYLWFAEVEFLEGDRAMLEGSVTIVR